MKGRTVWAVIAIAALLMAGCSSGDDSDEASSGGGGSAVTEDTRTSGPVVGVVVESLITGLQSDNPIQTITVQLDSGEEVECVEDVLGGGIPDERSQGVQGAEGPPGPGVNIELEQTDDGDWDCLRYVES